MHFNQELCAEIAAATFQGSADVTRSAPGGRRICDLHRSGSVSAHCWLLWLGHMPFTLCEQKLPLGLSGWLVVKETGEVGAGYLWPLVPNSGMNWLFLQSKGESRVYQEVKNTTELVEMEGMPDFRFSQVTESHSFCFSPTLEGHGVWMATFISLSSNSAQSPKFPYKLLNLWESRVEILRYKRQRNYCLGESIYCYSVGQELFLV